MSALYWTHNPKQIHSHYVSIKKKRVQCFWYCLWRMFIYLQGGLPRYLPTWLLKWDRTLKWSAPFKAKQPRCTWRFSGGSLERRRNRAPARKRQPQRYFMIFLKMPIPRTAWLYAFPDVLCGFIARWKVHSQPITWWVRYHAQSLGMNMLYTMLWYTCMILRSRLKCVFKAV